MKRRGIFELIACALPVIMVTITCSCTEKDYGFSPGPAKVSGTDEIVVTPAGGIFKALGGDVTLNFPADAVKQPVTISVSILNYKPAEAGTSTKSTSNLALKAIIIEPYTVFAKPAQLSLRYDGCLWNGTDIRDGLNLAVYLWENEICFTMGEVPCVCTVCQINSGQATICTCICQSGVVTVKTE